MSDENYYVVFLIITFIFVEIWFVSFRERALQCLELFLIKQADDLDLGMRIDLHCANKYQTYFLPSVLVQQPAFTLPLVTETCDSVGCDAA